MSDALAICRLNFSSVLPPIAQSAYSTNSALWVFALYMGGVFLLAWFSNRLLRKRSFLSEYFLGSRSLGLWAFALTFAATSSSGGSFTGFPSLIYTHGWVLAMWIASYMVVPICTMGLLGKRLNQVARKTGAITVPDVLRDRFDSAALGLMAMMLIVFFMTINLVAQFKAGSEILRTLLLDVPLFQQVTAAVAHGTADMPLLSNVHPGYLVCLVTFSVTVIFYTTYGGFHAVVWTDVLQGVVMVGGVMVLLPLTLWQVGGLTRANERLGQLTPPLRAIGALELAEPAPENIVVPAGTWVRPDETIPGGSSVIRIGRPTTIRAGETRVDDVPMLAPTAASEIERAEQAAAQQSFASDRLTPVISQWTRPPHDRDQPGVYLSGPGPEVGSEQGLGFLPFSLAISFFFMWAISGAGQPGNMVRLMAFRNSLTLSRAIFTVSIYYTLIYFPLVIIFCCARLLLPGLDQESDRIMPAMAVAITGNAGAPWLAGLLVAAPFAAIMSTVDSFLLVISSALVRDLYQRNINPAASERTIKRLSYGFTLIVGFCATAVALYPPTFLQDIIVYTGGGLAAVFLIPVAMGLYWPRTTLPGAIAAMLGGFAAHLSLYLVPFAAQLSRVWQGQPAGAFRPLRPLGFDPVLWGLVASLVAGVAVTLLSGPPPERLVRRYFLRGGEADSASA